MRPPEQRENKTRKDNNKAQKRWNQAESQIHLASQQNKKYIFIALSNLFQFFLKKKTEKFIGIAQNSFCDNNNDSTDIMQSLFHIISAFSTSLFFKYFLSQYSGKEDVSSIILVPYRCTHPVVASVQQQSLDQSILYNNINHMSS